MTGFTAHNVTLDDGTQTLPTHPLLVASDWFKSAARALKVMFPDPTKARIADLGCLEGGFALEFARMGFTVVGIEGRRSNFEQCMFLKERTNQPNLSFVLDNVWNLERHGEFDAYFCSGLLYHLDRPVSFISLMGKLARRGVIINTHFADEDTTGTFRLGPITEHDGGSGRWYHEHDVDSAEEIEKLKWSSMENKVSFWLERRSILQAIREAGFTFVAEQFDLMDMDIGIAMKRGGFYRENLRGTFIGIKD